MDILTNGEISDPQKWNRMGVIKVTTIEMNNLSIEIRKKGLLIYNTDVNDLLVNKGTADSPKFRYLFEEIGSMELYIGDSEELFQHWKICNGQSLSIADYPDLYAVIGTTFGHTGSTHFNIPNYRNKFPRGSSGVIGAVGGANKVKLTTTQMPAHTHTYENHGGFFSSGSGIRWPNSGTTSYGNDQSSTEGIEKTGEGETHENRPPYIQLHIIIKVR